MHSQLLDVYFLFFFLFSCYKNACCVKISLSDTSITTPLPPCPSHCHIRLATLHAGVGPRNALYTRTPCAGNKIHSDVPALETLQSKTAHLFIIHCKWCNIPYCFSSEEKEGKKHTSPSESEACVTPAQYFDRDHYRKPLREDLMEKGMQRSQITLNGDRGRMAFLNPKFCTARLQLLQSCPDKTAAEITPASFT